MQYIFFSLRFSQISIYSSLSHFGNNYPVKSENTFNRIVGRIHFWFYNPYPSTITARMSHSRRQLIRNNKILREN